MATEKASASSGNLQVPASQELQLLRHVYESISANGFSGLRTEPFPDDVNYFRFKFDLTGIGSIEIELSGKPKTFNKRAAAGFDPLLSIETAPCAPENAKAAQILQTCEAVYESNKGDCNLFVKAASKPHFGEIFRGLDADGIIGKLADAASGWTGTKSIVECVKQAQSGNFVIGGMTSEELGGDHGHLAVIVACPTQPSGNTRVPIGYAGSIGGASIKGDRLTTTFKAQSVRDEKVSYFWKEPLQERLSISAEEYLAGATLQVRIAFQASGEGTLTYGGSSIPCLGKPGQAYPKDQIVENVEGVQYQGDYGNAFKFKRWISKEFVDPQGNPAVMLWSVKIDGTKGIFVHEDPDTIDTNGGPSQGCIHLASPNAEAFYNWITARVRITISYPW
jgi:hypothetical protein